MAGRPARVRRGGLDRTPPRPAFAHGTRVTLPAPEGDDLHLFGCFHVSQRNTFTGKLTPAMLREVLRTAAEAAGAPTRK
ncbi:hypothetical protein SHIRM173S_05764 [Streptomyces hirsutus]